MKQEIIEAIEQVLVSNGYSVRLIDIHDDVEKKS